MTAAILFLGPSRSSAIERSPQPRSRSRRILDTVSLLDVAAPLWRRAARRRAHGPQPGREPALRAGGHGADRGESMSERSDYVSIEIDGQRIDTWTEYASRATCSRRPTPSS